LEKKLPEHVDPLIWWQIDARPFPTLTSLAKTVLCVPATNFCAQWTLLQQCWLHCQ